jgi:hypothetical protein
MTVEQAIFRQPLRGIGSVNSMFLGNRRTQQLDTATEEVIYIVSYLFIAFSWRAKPVWRRLESYRSAASRKGLRGENQYWAILFLGRYKYGELALHVGKSQILDSKIRSCVVLDSVPRMTALARTSSNLKLQIHSLVREGAPHEQSRNSDSKEKPAYGPQMGNWHQDRLADWPSVQT